MKTTIEDFNSRLDEVQERISEFEDRAVKLSQMEQQNKQKRSENSLRDLWDNIKQNNIHTTRVMKEGKIKDKKVI